ncbi:MAG: DUF3604 domain-containing protein [Alphaproteobacteria bacterium]|nr:DUF3604 domain-containing protein [Alphaproteobacteria bacterium]
MTRRTLRTLIGALSVATLLAACDERKDAETASPPATEAEAPPAPEPAADPTPPAETALPSKTAADRVPLYGDLHVHSAASFDSYTFGNRVTQEDAYRFAHGEEVAIWGDRKVKLDRPLDFAGVTDHIEWWGVPDLCTDENSGVYDTDTCLALRDQDWGRLNGGKLGAGYSAIPPERAAGFCEGEEGMKRCNDLRAMVWDMTRTNAAKFYEPGKFTTFIGYEFTQPAPSGGHLHRNVIFANTHVPDEPKSTYDLVFDSELWRWLEEACTGACDVIAIPHNQNISWGYAFSLERRDGTPYTDEDLARRARIERIAEMFQIKGASECTVGVLTSDEECGFEQVFPVCAEGDKRGCQRFGSTARDGLKLGLKTEAERGVNPFKYGFIGSTDTHNATPGATEEATFPGGHGRRDASLETRLTPVPLGQSGFLRFNPGGLAAVWAEENTREAIFAAMKRRETFATSGGRMAVRVFASFGFPDGLDADPDRIAKAYAQGVAMGSDLPRGDGAPALLVEATRDPMSAPLAKIQIVKGWLDGEDMREQVFDIACSDGLSPDPETHQCPDNGAAVDMATCAYSADKGADAMTMLWRDPEFDAAKRAFYYARVLENPTCRWSTAQALADGREPPSADWVPPLIRERAWSSPVWYTP